MTQYWLSTPVGLHSWDFVFYSKKEAEEVLQMNKADLRTLVRLFTGHWAERPHKYNCHERCDRLQVMRRKRLRDISSAYRL